MISLFPVYGMTIDIADDTLPLLQTTDPEPLEAYETDPIVVAYRDILDPLVGPLTRVEAGPIGGNVLAWAGVDATGTVRSGTMRMDADSAEGERSITLSWRVEVDGS